MTDWEIDWYTCRADQDDVKAGTAKKAGDALWRCARSIGPISPDHNHWAGWNISLDEKQALFVQARCSATEAHVIRCNDMNVCVVLGSEEDANKRMAAESERYYQRQKGSWVTWYPRKWAELSEAQREEVDRQRYKERCYWRVESHTLD